MIGISYKVNLVYADYTLYIKHVLLSDINHGFKNEW